MKLSVIILNYNVKYFLELCLKSVQEAIASIDAEIIVIDNNSSDGSHAMLAKKFSSVIVIANKDNLGFSKANNQGVKIAKGEFICILNPDTVIAEDTFLKLINFCKNKSNLGAVGCKLIDGSGKFLPESKRNIPLLKVALRKIFFQDGNYYANHVGQNDIGNIDILVGAFMFMKRRTYHKVNGFDENYFMYGEDIDLSYKLLQAGFKNYYFGDITCIHFKGESTNRDKKYIKLFYDAMRVFYEKHFKLNRIVDTLVILGIQLVSFFTKPKRISELQPGMYYMISGNGCRNLEKVLNKEIKVQNHLKGIKQASEIIFDANSISYKEIIQNIEMLAKSDNLSFKILPKKSGFIIGSNNAINKGRVIQFD